MEQDTDDVQVLRDEIAALREELARLMAAMPDTGPTEQSGERASDRDFAGEIRDELKDSIDRARAIVEEKGREFMDKARTDGVDAMADLETRIRQYPVLSVFLVFIAGLLLGKLFERR